MFITSSSLLYIYVNVESVIQLKFNSHFRCGGALACVAICAQWPHSLWLEHLYGVLWRPSNSKRRIQGTCTVAPVSLPYKFVHCNFKLYLYTYIVVLKHIWVYRYFNIVKYTCKPANYDLLHVGPVHLFEDKPLPNANIMVY